MRLNLGFVSVELIYMRSKGPSPDEKNLVSGHPRDPPPHTPDNITHSAYHHQEACK